MKKQRITKKVKVIIAAAISIVTISVIVYYSISEYDVARQMLEAKSFIKSGNILKAQQLLEAVSSKDSGNEEACKLLAGIYRSNGNYIAAARLWVKVQKLDPFDGNAVSMQALNLLAGGANKAVIELLEPLFKNNKLLKIDKIYLAKAYFFSGNLIKSETIVNELIKTSPDNANLLLLMGNIEVFKQNFEKAEQIFKSIDSSDLTVRSAILTGLANCAAARKDYKKSELLYKKSVSVSKKSFQAEQILADYYRRYGDVHKSLQIYSKLLEKHPESLEIIITTAELYTSLGDSKAIDGLLKKIKGRGAIYIKGSYYLKALSAFISNDYASAIKYLEWTGNSFKKNPAYQWVLLYSAIKTRNQALTETALRNFSCSYIKNRKKRCSTRIFIE